MPIRHRMLGFTLAALLMSSGARADLEPCSKNHYILDEPCVAAWTPVNDGLVDRDIRVLAIDPLRQATLYAGGTGGVFKSVDGGAWILTGLRMADRALIDTSAALNRFSNIGVFRADSVVAHLAIDPVDPDTLYAGTRAIHGATYLQRRFFKSTDGGATWTDDAVPPISGVDNIHAIVVAPSDPATVYVLDYDDSTGDTWAPVVSSADRGASWKGLQYQVLNVLAVDPLDARTVYGGSFDFGPFNGDLPTGVLKSADGGETWAATGLAGHGISALAVDPSDPGVLYAATVGGYGGYLWSSVFTGLFRSNDQGATWTAINEGLADLIDTASVISAIAFDPRDARIVYFGTTLDGVYRTADGGATWSPFNEGLGSQSVRSLAFAADEQGTLYAGTIAGVFKVVTGPAAAR